MLLCPLRELIALFQMEIPGWNKGRSHFVEGMERYRKEGEGGMTGEEGVEKIGAIPPAIISQIKI